MHTCTWRSLMAKWLNDGIKIVLARLCQGMLICTPQSGQVPYFIDVAVADLKIFQAILSLDGSLSSNFSNIIIGW